MQTCLQVAFIPPTFLLQDVMWYSTVTHQNNIFIADLYSSSSRESHLTPNQKRKSRIEQNGFKTFMELR